MPLSDKDIGNYDIMIERHSIAALIILYLFELGAHIKDYIRNKPANLDSYG